MVSRLFHLVSALGAAAAIATVSSFAQAAEQAGVAAAVRGDVTLVASTPADAGRVVGQNLGSGDKIFLGDEISTGPNSGMQIMLLDETIFTIGPDAGLVIDEFVYDPATNAGQVTASVVKGAFRFVSGRVAKEEPSNMNVRTPVGTIGIRGTSAAGVITLPDPTNPGSNISGTFVLLGPGADNNAGERAGRILVTNGGTTVEISRSGFGTVIASPELPPGTPIRISPAQVAALTGGLGTDGGARPGNNGDGGGDGGSQGNGSSSGSGRSGGQGSGSGNPGSGGSGGAGSGGSSGANLNQATNLSGQKLGSGVSNAGFLTQVGDTQNTADRQTDQFAQDLGNASNLASTSITTFDQLRTIQTGTATFSFGTVSMAHISGPNSGSGQFDANASIDFGARTLDLNITNITYSFDTGLNALTTTGTFTFDANGSGNSSFETDTGFVSETWTSSSTANSANFPTAPSDGSTATVSAAIRNDVNAGTIAA